MTKPRKTPPSDPVVAAHRVVARLTKTEDPPTRKKLPPKDPAAVALGRKGGRSRARNLTPEQLREIGKKGAAARWKKDAEGEP